MIKFAIITCFILGGCTATVLNSQMSEDKESLFSETESLVGGACPPTCPHLLPAPDANGLSAIPTGCAQCYDSLSSNSGWPPPFKPGFLALRMDPSERFVVQCFMLPRWTHARVAWINGEAIKDRLSVVDEEGIITTWNDHVRFVDYVGNAYGRKDLEDKRIWDEYHWPIGWCRQVNR